jgi:hypothetical protein
MTTKLVRVPGAMGKKPKPKNVAIVRRAALIRLSIFAVMIYAPASDCNSWPEDRDSRPPGGYRSRP